MPLVGETPSCLASDFDEAHHPLHADQPSSHHRSASMVVDAGCFAPAAAALPRRHSFGSEGAEALDHDSLASSMEGLAGATIASVTVVLDDSPLGPLDSPLGPLPAGVVDGSPARADQQRFSAPALHLPSPAPPTPATDAHPPQRQAPASPRGKANATELQPRPGPHESLGHLATNASNVVSAAQKLSRTSSRRRQEVVVESSAGVNGLRAPVRLLPNALNKNKVHEFGWVTPVPQAIVANAALPVLELQTGTRGQSLFLVCGGCPNSFCGMQAVLYAYMQTPTPTLDFWWIKPYKADSSRLDRATLDRHSKGEHKNDPGRSRALYAQFSDLFALGGGAEAEARASRAGGGKLRFEVAWSGPSQSVPRALIVDVVSGARYYIYLIWQEDWTSNPFARSKYIKGKFVYQREPGASSFFARPYAYRDGVLSVPPHPELEESVAAPMPTDAIQARCLDDS